MEESFVVSRKLVVKGNLKSSRESTSSLQAKIVDSNCISFGFSFGFRICTPAWALYLHAAYRWKALDLT